MRLIDADALIEAMEERKKIWLSECEYNDAIREVKEAPTVEAYIFEQVQDLVALNKKLSEERPHGECKTCKHYNPYRDQFSYGHRGDGYCKSTITNADGQAYINCHDEWYCANYEKEGE